jgi:hypothetical protein
MPALSQRQRQLYRHRVNIFREFHPIDGATGVPQPPYWKMLYVNVPCMYNYTDNISDPIDAVGRIKRNTLFTDDKLQLGVDQDIQDADVVMNATFYPDGKPTELYGQIHTVLGTYKATFNTGFRRPNKRSVLIAVMEKPPQGILDLLTAAAGWLIGR